MRKNNLILNLLLALAMFLSSQGKGEQDDGQIVVRLSTESRLIPIYAAPIYMDDAGFGRAYISKLEKILQFDLTHNGMTYLIEHPGPIGTFEEINELDDWDKNSAYYVIKLRVKGNTLQGRVLSLTANAAKTIDGLELTGNISDDRQQIHLLADAIHTAIFGKEGIASNRFLYTIKLKGAKDWTSDVWEADYDGENARQVTKDCGYCVTPAYIPPKPGYASGHFLFISYKTGQSKIYIGSLKDGSAQRLTYLKGNQLMPAINRGRDKIAFITDYTGNPDLFLQPFNPEAGAVGKPQQIYSTYKATQGTPAFNPEGTKVAFVSDKDGSPRIYVMDIPESGASLKDLKAALITKQNKENSAPSWSPDGTKLAYCAFSGGHRQIWIYDFNTGKERQLTQGPGNKENPAWAPNSLHLIFNSTGKDGSDLYLINLNQPEAVKISSGIGEKRFPSWESINLGKSQI